jgi:hypothetical protein
MRMPLRFHVLLCEAILLPVVLPPSVFAQPWQQDDAILNPGGIPLASFSLPRFADLDDAGVLALLAGNYDGTSNYLRKV